MKLMVLMIFVLILGYKAQSIKDFLNYYLYNSDVTIELENKVDVHSQTLNLLKLLW
jgi:hypothetical protein